jgi:hypothetical protein
LRIKAINFCKGRKSEQLITLTGGIDGTSDVVPQWVRVIVYICCCSHDNRYGHHCINSALANACPDSFTERVLCLG